MDGLEENKTIELNWKISEQIDTRPELRVLMDEIWGIGRFGGLDLGIVSEKGIESKDGKYTIHGIESGPNKGNWLVREYYENGDYKNLVVAGPEAFKEVRSGKFSERGTALNLIAAGEMLGADPTSTYRENILNGWKEACKPENIVSSLLLAIAVIKTPLSGMVRKVGGNAAKTGTTVLGHYPEYVKPAESIGARRFQIPTSVWNKMSAAEQWTANTKFLDRMILRGDKIRLATPLNQVKPGSFSQKELNYLFDKGYKVSSDGLWLTK